MEGVLISDEKCCAKKSIFELYLEAGESRWRKAGDLRSAPHYVGKQWTVLERGRMRARAEPAGCERRELTE
jgi:hypothetical protein